MFTASMEIYGTAVADRLDNNTGMLRRRYYRQHCTLDFGSYTKDLSAINDDLSSVFILDNSPGAYRAYPGTYSTFPNLLTITYTKMYVYVPMFQTMQFRSSHGSTTHPTRLCSTSFRCWTLSDSCLTSDPSCQETEKLTETSPHGKTSFPLLIQQCPLTQPIIS